MEQVQMAKATKVAENLENVYPNRMKKCSKGWAPGWAKSERLVVALAKENEFQTSK
jgi:hypothetical protein